MVSQSKIFEILKRVEKPARYLGQEVNSITKDLTKVDLKVALVMPETYEIAQSNLGLQILYNILNKIPNVAAERVYAPWVDLEQELRKEKVAPFSLENKIPLNEFDLIGISLPYELSYTNILTMFDLAGIPFRSKDRSEEKGSFPLIIGGGNQAFNPEPVADFFDGFVVGDLEDAIVKIVEKMIDFKCRGESCVRPKNVGSVENVGDDAQIRANTRFAPTVLKKIDLLHQLTSIQGFYVPSFFDISYHDDGTIEKIHPLFLDYTSVKKSTVVDLDQADFPTAPIVPSAKTVHDRLAVEVQRGCVRACRFCQAGYIYRPERQRSPETVLKLIEEGMENTGAEEISLLSLSVGDYGCLLPVVRELFNRYENKKVAISLPATRTDTFSPEVIQEIKRVRKTGFTVAPEAGTPRMRRIINKGNSREDLFKTVENIFKEGWQLVKFYYMCGLPFETFDDLRGIADEGEEALKIGKKYSSRTRINLSVSPHVPKPHTPFQWERQDSIEETKSKIEFIKRHLQSRAVDFKWHDPEQSYLEGVFARGDRRLSYAIEKAWELGCRFDGWDEKFDLKKWIEAFQLSHINPDFYVTRARSKEEIFPWDHLFSDLKKEFLWEERNAAYQENFIPDCSTDRCTDCGICDFHETKNVNYRVDQTSGAVIPFTTRGRVIQKKIPSLEAILLDLPMYKILQEAQSNGIAPTAEKIHLNIGHSDFEKFNPLTERKREDGFSSLSKDYTSYRLRFTKVGEVSFLSHLEMMGVLKRALSRVQVPIRFSEGYHPQPRLSMGQPISVGIESVSEFFDIEIEGELVPAEFIGKINTALPKGLQILSCEKISSKTASISSSEIGSTWKIEFSEPYPGGVEKLREKIEWLEAQPELLTTRRRQRSEKTVDIKPFIGSFKVLSDRLLQLSTKALLQSSTKPQEVLHHLLKENERMLKNIRILKTDSLFQPDVQ